MFVCADSNLSNTPAVANRAKADTWEKFEVIVTRNGSAGFRSLNNNRYLSARNDQKETPLTVTASSIQLWEEFRIYRRGNDYYLKAQVNDKYVTAVIGTANTPLRARADIPQDWERFEIDAEVIPKPSRKF